MSQIAIYLLNSPHQSYIHLFTYSFTPHWLLKLFTLVARFPPYIFMSSHYSPMNSHMHLFINSINNCNISSRIRVQTHRSPSLSLGEPLSLLLHLPVKQWYQSPPAHVTRCVTHHFWGQNSGRELLQECLGMSRESLTLALISIPLCWRSETKQNTQFLYDDTGIK